MGDYGAGFAGIIGTILNDRLVQAGGRIFTLAQASTMPGTIGSPKYAFDPRPVKKRAERGELEDFALEKLGHTFILLRNEQNGAIVVPEIDGQLLPPSIVGTVATISIQTGGGYISVQITSSTVQTATSTLASRSGV